MGRMESRLMSKVFSVLEEPTLKLTYKEIFAKKKPATAYAVLSSVLEERGHQTIDTVELIIGRLNDTSDMSLEKCPYAEMLYEIAFAFPFKETSGAHKHYQLFNSMLGLWWLDNLGGLESLGPFIIKYGTYESYLWDFYNYENIPELFRLNTLLVEDDVGMPVSLCDGMSKSERNSEIRWLHEVYSTKVCALNTDRVFRRANRLAKKVDNRDKKIADLTAQLTSLRKSKEPVRLPAVEVKTYEKEYDEAVGSLMCKDEYIQRLLNKIEMYESSTTAPDLEIMQELYEERVTDVDLSKYRLLIVADFYGDRYKTLGDVMSYTDKAHDLVRFDKYDLILVVTGCVHHRTFDRVQSECSRRNIPMRLTSKINNEAIARELKEYFARNK